MVRAHGRVLGDAALLDLVDTLGRSRPAPEPLDVLLHEPGVTDVLVNGPDQVYVDRGDGLQPAAWPFADDAAVRRLAQRLAAAGGRRLDDASPFVDVRLADGTRLHAALAPLARPGTLLSLRVPPAGLHPRRARSRRPRRPGARRARRLVAAAAAVPGHRRDGHRQDNAAGGAAARCRRPSGSSSSRTRPSCVPTTRTSSGSRRGRRTSRAPARSGCATWSGRRCGCGPTGWWSARSAAPRSSTCWRRSTPATRAGAAPCTPTPPPTCRPGWRRSA